MDITTLERAAETLLAPPNLVSAVDRKTAEQLFIDLKKEITLPVAQQIIGSTQHQFVLYQVAQVFGEVILREWALLDTTQIEPAYKQLIQYVAENASLSNYVVAEFLRSTAMILKRGILDKKTGDPEQLFELIHNLLANPEARLQSIGCQLISAITEQFSSSWRNSKFNITWDFHLAAKSEFERTGLRRLLEMSLRTLHALSAQPDVVNNEFERRLAEKFLEVTENIFSWNFATKIFRRLFSSNQSSCSFRPPASWADLIANDEFFTLFFNLHSRIRQCESLAIRSLSCLVQLASLAGDIMSNGEFAAHFMQLYVSHLMQLFPEGPLPYETAHFCQLLNRLFVFRPVQSLMRLPEDLRRSFFVYITQYTQHLTEQAMRKAIGESDHADHTSLAQLYDGWNIILRGRWRTVIPEEQQPAVDEELIAGPTWQLVCAFLRSVQSPPGGSRPAVCDEDGADEDEQDDRQLFLDLLNPLCTFACYTLPQFVAAITSTFGEKLVELQALAAAGGADAARLAVWQEDMHWLLLIIANTVVGEDMDGSCHTQPEVLDHSVDLCRARGAAFSADATQAHLMACIERPTEQRPAGGDIDPFMGLIGEVLAWCSMEQQLSASAPHMVSPELARTSMFALRRILNAASHVSEYDDADPLWLPVLPSEGALSDLLVRFCLHKVFTTLSTFSGEDKLCGDAVELLIGLIESRAPALAAAPDLFEHLGRIDISRLPARTQLMKALVLIGAAANSEQLQNNMYIRILQPLGEKFHGVCSLPSSSAVDSELVDLLQCFDGVAKASQSHSALILFKFLSPVLEACVPLMKSRALSQSVISAILTLILDVTTKVSIYVEEKDDSMRLYRCLLAIVESYRVEQGTRLAVMKEDEEDKASDLVLFMDILSNVLSRDILDTAEDRLATGTQVAMTSLEMLLSIMTESVLEMPDVAMKFYRLLLYLVEFSPESLAAMSAQLLHAACECLRVGLSGKFGLEITSTCLETLCEISQFFASNREKVTPDLADHVTGLIPRVFEACLENSCEASLFAEASSALYSLVCFNQSGFDSFVGELLSRRANAGAVAQLREAFGELFQGQPPVPGRREKIAFRKKMEVFLNKIQGLLSCN